MTSNVKGKIERKSKSKNLPNFDLLGGLEIRGELRCIRPYLDSKTASNIAASIVHSKLDYCNSLYYNLPSLN